MGFDWDSRDLKCAADVGRMAALGKYAVEFDAYGCTYWQEGEQYYRASSKGEEIFNFVRSCRQQGGYATPPEHFCFQTMVPVEMREHFAQQTKLELIERIRGKYKGLYAVLQPLAETLPNDESLPFLLKEIEALEGHFDDMALQRFAGTMDFAYDAKILSDAGRALLEEWLLNERRQMEDDPVTTERCERHFYGFAYQKDKGEIVYFCDAQKLTVLERQLELIMKGNLVCPILYKQYWFHHTAQIAAARKLFLAELEKWQGTAYLAYLQELKRLNGVIDDADLKNGITKLRETVSDEAAAVLVYYGHLWNKKYL